MGRRLNVSTPTVINTELVPLDESFYLDVDGQMEQWYYDNTEQYAPNRKVTPLLLVPVISAFDKDTSTSYTPAFNTTQWFANEWNESQGKYVETEITNQVDSGSADYVIQGNNLLVKKNVSYSHAVTIRCVATYIDPRDSGVTYTVEDSVNLTTNRTADVVFPEVDIISPSGRAYNPLVDDTNSQYDFKGVTTNNPVQPLNTDVRRYSVDVDGTEEILNSGEAVAPIMDIRYGENRMTDQEFMYRQTAGGTLVGESIDKAYIERIKGNTVAWNQMMFNQNLQNAHAGWSVDWTVASETSSEITLTGLSGSIGFQCGKYSINGHKYYITFRIKVENGGGSETPNYGAIFFCGGSMLPSLTFGQYSIIKTIKAATSVGLIGFSFYPAVNIKATIDKTYGVCVYDLTLIYGAGNEPSIVAQFEADYERWFGKPLSYEEYDEGSLRPVLMQSIKTTGFNQWDEEYTLTGLKADGTTDTDNIYLTSKNFIPVKGGTAYFFNYNGSKIAGMKICQYDASYNHIGTNIGKSGSQSKQFSFTTEDGCRYIKFNFDYNYGTTYTNDICINISNQSKNGTYEPYNEKVQGFDVTAIKGKLNGAGNSVTIFPDGLKKVGNIQDEIFVEGGVVKAIKRIGSVDMGSLQYQNDSSRAIYTYFSELPLTKTASGWMNNLVCGRFTASAGAMDDKSMSVLMNGNLYVCDSSYSDAATFKSAMQGVMLYYELATPQTYVLDPITDFVWYGIKNGQEVLADTLPWYVSGQGTDNLVVDAMYGENINVVLRCKMMDGETLSPSKAYATLNWRTPDIEPFVQSDNGGAVRSDTEDMTFDTIVNVNGEVLSDALKRKHLAFNWKIRKNNTSTEIDKGWGQRITIDASDLRNVKGSGSTLASTLVSNEVYLKGAYEEVTDNGEVVTYNGEKVYGRPID